MKALAQGYIVQFILIATAFGSSILGSPFAMACEATQLEKGKLTIIKTGPVVGPCSILISPGTLKAGVRSYQFSPAGTVSITTTYSSTGKASADDTDRTFFVYPKFLGNARFGIKSATDASVEINLPYGGTAILNPQTGKMTKLSSLDYFESAKIEANDRNNKATVKLTPKNHLLVIDAGIGHGGGAYYMPVDRSGKFKRGYTKSTITDGSGKSCEISNERIFFYVWYANEHDTSHYSDPPSGTKVIHTGDARLKPETELQHVLLSDPNCKKLDLSSLSTVSTGGGEPQSSTDGNSLSPQ